jgi:hypothetical protein
VLVSPDACPAPPFALRLLLVRTGRSRFLQVTLSTLALAALGCSAELEQFTADAESGSTHALISVERSGVAEQPEAARAGALAGFVRIPADVDSKALVELVGLSRPLPAVGQCRSATEEPPAASPSSVGHVEFLEAGDVSIYAAEEPATLAPHAFPTVTELISGVVYTTRDRSAVPLPAATRYGIRVTGGAAVPPFAIEREAPPELDSVTVGGVPLAEVSEIRLSEPVDLTWSVGAAGDLVIVELASADGTKSALCTFRDDAGAGSVAGRTLSVAGAGRLSLRRLRVIELSQSGLDAGELRFDFELAQSVTFGE